MTTDPDRNMFDLELLRLLDMARERGAAEAGVQFAVLGAAALLRHLVAAGLAPADPALELLEVWAVELRRAAGLPAVEAEPETLRH